MQENNRRGRSASSWELDYKGTKLFKNYFHSLQASVSTTFYNTADTIVCLSTCGPGNKLHLPESTYKNCENVIASPSFPALNR